VEKNCLELISVVAPDTTHPCGFQKKTYQETSIVRFRWEVCPAVMLSLVSSPILDGIVPTDIYSTNNSFKCVSSPKSVGIVPIMLLEESVIIASSFENEGIKQSVSLIVPRSVG
jgi:hypothetical protein